MVFSRSKRLPALPKCSNCTKLSINMLYFLDALLPIEQQTDRLTDRQNNGNVAPCFRYLEIIKCEKK